MKALSVLSALLALAGVTAVPAAKANVFANSQIQLPGYVSVDLDTGEHILVGVAGGQGGFTDFQWANVPPDPSQASYGHDRVDEWFTFEGRGSYTGGFYTSLTTGIATPVIATQAEGYSGPMPGPGQVATAYADIDMGSTPQPGTRAQGFWVAPRSRVTVMLNYQLHDRIDGLGCTATLGCESVDALVGFSAWMPAFPSQSFAELQTLNLDWNSSGDTDVQKTGTMRFTLVNETTQWQGLVYALTVRSLVTITPVPEPASAALMGLGLLALAAVRRRARSARPR